MEIVCKPPSDCNDIEISAFCCLLRKGDEVDPEDLEERVRSRGVMLTFLLSNGILIGIGAAKYPDTEYKNKIFSKAGMLENASLNEYEVGWFYILDQ
jgi:hypothetical protein